MLNLKCSFRFPSQSTGSPRKKILKNMEIRGDGESEREREKEREREREYTEYGIRKFYSIRP